MVDLVCDHYIDKHPHIYPLTASMGDGYPEEAAPIIDEAILVLHEVLKESHV